MSFMRVIIINYFKMLFRSECNMFQRHKAIQLKKLFSLLMTVIDIINIIVIN